MKIIDRLIDRLAAKVAQRLQSKTWQTRVPVAVTTWRQWLVVLSWDGRLYVADLDHNGQFIFTEMHIF